MYSLDLIYSHLYSEVKIWDYFGSFLKMAQGMFVQYFALLKQKYFSARPWN